MATTALGEPPSNLARENLVAWCIVPFDAAKRGPEARAAMLADLGLSRCAYDWRTEHVGSFEDEILAYRRHGIEFFAFWGGHESAYALFEEYDLHPQIWKTAPSPAGHDQAERVAAAVAELTPLAKRTAELDCPLGLYNHGGWGGQPENLVAVCRALRADGYEHVGIVYNWHHAHDRIDDWPEVLGMIHPFLHCLNLNGMIQGGTPKILPLGQGGEEARMVEALVASGYDGPVGILDHRPEIDAREALSENLLGLERIVDPGTGDR